MIGIFCNGFRHLFKNAENHKPKLALVWKQHSVWICKYKLLENGNLVFIDTDEGVSRNRELANEEVYDFVASSRYYAILRLDSKNDEMWFNSYLHGGAMIMLPDDFQQMFENFCKNNNKQINNLIDKYGPPSAYHKFLYSICGNSINFYSWLLKNYFSYNVFIDVLFFIMQWNEKFASYANKLTKGTITAYKGYDDIVQLQSEMINILKGKRSNDSLMEFNTMQKHMLKDNNSPEIMEILNDFNKRPQAQRKNFVQKMSSVDDFDELVHNLRLFCESHFKWNRESFLEYLNNTQNLAFTIVFDENNVVIVKIKDYETIRKIAKTTSWCISKNKTYWNNYISEKKNATQYVMFDFKEPVDTNNSIVGFTVDAHVGITHAHSFKNDALIYDNQSRENLFELSTYLPVISSSRNDIFALLQKNNVPMHLFNGNTHDIFRFKWSKDSLLKHLSTNDALECVGGEIILDNGNQIVIKCGEKLKELIGYLVKHPYVEYFQNVYNARRARHSTEYAYTLFFFDFGEDVAIKRSFFAIPFHKRSEGDEIPYTISNLKGEGISTYCCDSIANLFNLPSNTVKCKDNIYYILENAFLSCDVNYANKLLSTNKITDFRRKKITEDDMYRLREGLINSFCHYGSFDLFESIYNNGFTVSDFCDKNFFFSILHDIIHVAISQIHFISEIPTDYDIALFDQHKLNDVNKCKYIATTKLLAKMVEHEPLNLFVEYARHNVYNVDLIYPGIHDKLFLTLINTVKNINAPTLSDVMKQIIRLSNNSSRTDILQAILDKKPNEKLKEMMSIASAI